MDLAVELRERAHRLFHLVGVAPAGPLEGARHLQRWIADGAHGDMGYMARTAQLRGDPRLVLPGCRSVLVVAMSYHHPGPPSTEVMGGGTVWVSRYAAGRDYHKVLKKRLLQLGRWLESQRPGTPWRAFVDTGPVLERELAVLAGLGWMGKNSCLINRNLGSDLFLGVLLLGIDLPPDRPSREHCGRCTACLDACPTGALVAPGVLDARRCIAYLTIEHRAPIPSSFHRPISAMVTGCDICQEVCPWNRKAPAGHPDFAPVEHRDRPLLHAMEALDEPAYREWTRGSAVKRVSFEMMQRNLRIARSNLDH